MIVETRQINCRKISPISKYSVAIVGTRQINSIRPPYKWVCYIRSGWRSFPSTFLQCKDLRLHTRNEHRQTKNVKKQSLQYFRSSWVRMDVFFPFYCTCFYFILWWQDPHTSVYCMCEVATWIVAEIPPQWMTMNLPGILVKNSLLSSQGELVFCVTDVCIDSAGLCVSKKNNIILKFYFPTVMYL
jgi:hypothetical protein